MDTKRLEMIIITTDPNEAEEILSSIRRSNLAIRPVVVSTEEALASELQNTFTDLVLFDVQKSEIELGSVRNIITTAGKRLPIIALTHNPIKDPMEYLESGIEDVVEASNHEHLCHVVIRTAR
ncbi:hypothetical protein, partial [Acidihalobacter prosperus]